MNSTPRQQKSILVVDDEPDIRDSLADYIETLNHFTLYRASNGKEALEILNKVNADMVISDIKMPKGDGVFLIGSLQEKIRGGLKFVFMTGYSDVTRERAIELGAREIFYKPFSIVEFGKYIIKTLEN